MSLKNKRVLITGGATRLGKRFSEALAAEGAQLFIHYHQNLTGAERVGGYSAQHGHKVYVFQADFRIAEQVFALATKIKQLTPTLDILIHNASIFPEPRIVRAAHNLSQERLDAWLEAFSVHLDAPFFLTQELTPSLKRASGQVITLLDASAGSGMLSRAAYSLSKLSLENFTTFAAKALGPKIRVNGLKLGPTLPADGMPKKELNQLDWGDPDHAVAALVALAKDKNSTGKIFQVDDF